MLFVIFVPLLLVFAGLSNFLRVISLAGGVFLSLQYVLIALVGQRVLQFRGAKKTFLNFIVLVFLFAVVYEVYFFIIAD